MLTFMIQIRSDLLSSNILCCLLLLTKTTVSGHTGQFILQVMLSACLHGTQGSWQIFFHWI